MRFGRRSAPLTPLIATQQYILNLFPNPRPRCIDKGTYYISDGEWTHGRCFTTKRVPDLEDYAHSQKNRLCPVTTYYVAAYDQDRAFNVDPDKRPTSKNPVTLKATALTHATDKLATLYAARNLRYYAQEAVALAPSLTTTEHDETAHLITSLAAAVRILTLQRPLALAPQHADTPLHHDYLTNSRIVDDGLDALDLLITGQRIQHTLQQSGAGDMGLLMGNLTMSTEIATAIADVRRRLDTSTLTLTA